jgi:hypothetical protein
LILYLSMGKDQSHPRRKKHVKDGVAAPVGSPDNFVGGSPAKKGPRLSRPREIFLSAVVKQACAHV